MKPIGDISREANKKPKCGKPKGLRRPDSLVSSHPIELEDQQDEENSGDYSSHSSATPSTRQRRVSHRWDKVGSELVSKISPEPLRKKGRAFLIPMASVIFEESSVELAASKWNRQKHA
jgi:hypothetical protein